VKSTKTYVYQKNPSWCAETQRKPNSEWPDEKNHWLEPFSRGAPARGETAPRSEIGGGGGRQPSTGQVYKPVLIQFNQKIREGGNLARGRQVPLGDKRNSATPRKETPNREKKQSRGGQSKTNGSRKRTPKPNRRVPKREKIKLL